MQFSLFHHSIHRVGRNGVRSGRRKLKIFVIFNTRDDAHRKSTDGGYFFTKIEYEREIVLRGWLKKLWSRIASDTAATRNWITHPLEVGVGAAKNFVLFYHKMLRFFFEGERCIIDAKKSKEAWGRSFFQFRKVTAIRREERWNFPQHFCSLVSPIWRRFWFHFVSTRHAQALGFFCMVFVAENEKSISITTTEKRNWKVWFRKSGSDR